jgi:hypothetical protein
MPPYYIGGGGANPYSGLGGGPRPVGPIKGPAIGGGANPPGSPAGSPPTALPPFSTTTPGATDSGSPAPPSNVLGAQAVRATGDPKGYDPSYLQNLATAIGGLFSRPQGNLSLNPLGNLSEISPPSGMGGNAPLPGLPSTWLQDALNGLGFSFGTPTFSTTTPGGINSGGGGDSGGGGGDGNSSRGPRYNWQ